MEILRKTTNRVLRKNRVRSKVKGTTNRPRLTVTISSKHVSAQIIDDSQQKTLISSTTVGKKDLGSNLTEKAIWVGEDIAKKALKSSLTKIAFDRNGRKYHGRLLKLAEAARKQGLEF